MTDEPYRPGGEHCPKCGYRHDGRCNEKHREFARWFAQKYEGTFDSRCQSDGDIARAYEARQPEIDKLRAELEASRVAYKALAVETYDRHMARNGNWSWEDREDWPAITMAMAVGREARRKPVE